MFLWVGFLHICPVSREKAANADSANQVRLCQSTFTSDFVPFTGLCYHIVCMFSAQYSMKKYIKDS